MFIHHLNHPCCLEFSESQRPSQRSLDTASWWCKKFSNKNSELSIKINIKNGEPVCSVASYAQIGYYLCFEWNMTGPLGQELTVAHCWSQSVAILIWFEPAPGDAANQREKWCNIEICIDLWRWSFPILVMPKLLTAPLSNFGWQATHSSQNPMPKHA